MSLSDKAPAIALAARPGGEPGLSWADRWYGLRNRLIRSKAFQRWSAGFPLTRPVARRKATDLFDLVSGFVYSQILFAIVRLEVLEIVAERPRSVEAIADACRLPRASAERLCAAAAALGLLRHRGEGRYGLADLGAAMLGNPGIAAMVRHHELLYADLADPVALLRDPARPTKLADYWAYAASPAPGELGAEAVADYSRLMAASQEFIATEVLDAYPLGRHRQLMDLGGGEGAFVRAAAQRHTALQFVLFDLPAVAARAENAFREAGIAQRARAVGGDLFAGGLPQGSDVISLVRVLYDHPTERTLAILRAARAALAPGGTLLVAEPMAGTAGAEAMGAVYFSFYLLAMKGGEARNPETLIGLIREAGFTEARLLPTRRPLFTSLIVARATS